MLLASQVRFHSTGRADFAGSLGVFIGIMGDGLVLGSAWCLAPFGMQDELRDIMFCMMSRLATLAHCPLTLIQYHRNTGTLQPQDRLFDRYRCSHR